YCLSICHVITLRRTPSLFYRSRALRALLSFPTRRSSDLPTSTPTRSSGCTATWTAVRRSCCPCIRTTTAAPAWPPRSWATLPARSEEHTSELQSRFDLVCRLLLEKKKTRRRSARRGGTQR